MTSSETLPAYERDPYLRELPTRVIETGTVKGRHFVVLEDTILYPEGGGQPPDHGRIDDVGVVDVRKEDGAVRHFTERAVSEGPCVVTLDWTRRFDHMQQHTGQHLLSAVADAQFGWETTAFHLGPEVCDVELAVKDLSPEARVSLEEAVAREIRAARPVRPRRVSLEEYAALAVRSRGLPDGHEGDVRLIEIEGIDLNTCGGTHLTSTAELEAVALLSTESLRGGTRLFFAVGGRVRARLRDREAQAAGLRKILLAPDAGLVAAAEALSAKALLEAKNVERLTEQLAELVALELAGKPGSLVDWHGEGRDASFLSRVARTLSLTAKEKAAFLTTRNAAGVLFLVVAGDEMPADVPAMGRAAAEGLGGRGGGSGRLFQGKAPDLDGREAALKRIEEIVSQITE